MFNLQTARALILQEYRRRDIQPRKGMSLSRLWQNCMLQRMSKSNFDAALTSLVEDGHLGTDGTLQRALD